MTTGAPITGFTGTQLQNTLDAVDELINPKASTTTTPITLNALVVGDSNGRISGSTVLKQDASYTTDKIIYSSAGVLKSSAVSYNDVFTLSGANDVMGINRFGVAQQYKEVATPANSDTGFQKLYPKTTGWYIKDEAAAEDRIATCSSANTFSNANTFSGENIFTAANTFQAANTFSNQNTFSAEKGIKLTHSTYVDNKLLLKNSSDEIVSSALGEADIAPIASPTFTGTPAAPTASVGTNTTQIATTAFVAAQAILKDTTNSAAIIPETSATPTAVPDSGKIYTKADNQLYFQNGGGVSVRLTPSLVTKTYTIGYDGKAGMDANFAATADKVQQNFPISIPAFARVVDIAIISGEVFGPGPGYYVLSPIDVGSSSTGTQYASGLSLTQETATNNVASLPTSGAMYVAINNTASNVYIGVVPSINFEDMTSGYFTVYISYIDYGYIQSGGLTT